MWSHSFEKDMIKGAWKTGLSVFAVWMGWARRVNNECTWTQKTLSKLSLWGQWLLIDVYGRVGSSYSTRINSAMQLWCTITKLLSISLLLLWLLSVDKWEKGCMVWWIEVATVTATTTHLACGPKQDPQDPSGSVKTVRWVNVMPDQGHWWHSEEL